MIIKTFIKIHFKAYKLLYTSKCTFLFAKKCDSIRKRTSQYQIGGRFDSR